MPSRKFRSQGPILYNRYLTGHGEWLEQSAGEDPGDAYGEGFLPYSSGTGNGHHLFYMARSLRVDLSRLSMDKKRRYNHRQWMAYGLTRQVMTREAFIATHGHKALEWARDWMATRFGEPYMDDERLSTLLQNPFMRDVLVWSREGKVLAFALIVRGQWGAHYWFSFYHNSRSSDLPPGHGYMGDFLDWARLEGLPHAYLGTAYGEKSRYKSRGINGIEFWDGHRWKADRMELSQLRAMDDAGEDGESCAGSGTAQAPDYSLV
jgi:hypothetical protein